MNFQHIHHSPEDTGRKLNVHKTFRRRFLDVVCTFNLRPVSKGLVVSFSVILKNKSQNFPYYVPITVEPQDSSVE